MSEHLNRRTWFLLGREPLLSAAEIFSLLRRERVVFNHPVLDRQFLTISGNISADLINQLGGTIKIVDEIGNDFSEDVLINTIQKSLSALSGKIVFGISYYGENGAKKVDGWGKQLKKELKTEGRSVRYVFKGEPTLSSVTVEKNSLIDNGREFIIRENKGKYSVAETLAVQPFESFSERDYGRPGRDDVSGMLPPKLAMMMVNLTEAAPDEILLDPFCGSGTIISEAMLLGYQNVHGTDLSDKAIADSKQNINWLIEKTERLKNLNWETEQLPVEKLSTKFDPSSIGGIATEPYMGKPKKGRETRAELEKEAGELIQLYLNAFSEFKKILQPTAKVVFAIPRFMIGGLSVSISDKLLPELKKIGFSADPLLPESKSPFVIYQRPGQFVAREIWRFRIAK